MIAVFKRELGAYFNSVLGYLFTAFVLIFAGIYTMVYNLSGYYVHFEYALEGISFIYMVAIPLLTMRSVAEEKRQKTDQLLYSLPMQLSHVILGKYLAMVAVLLLPCCVMALYPLILSQWGAIPFASAYSTLLAFFLLGSCLIAVGLFISSITESQVSAAVITLVTVLILYFMSDLASFISSTGSASMIALSIVALIVTVVLYIMTHNVPVTLLFGIVSIGGVNVWYQQNPSAFSGLFEDIIAKLSLFDRFYTFVDGVFDLNHIVYYLSVIVVFLFLSVQAMEKRRWSE